MKTIKCKFCGEVLNEEEALVFEGVHMCSACEREHTRICEWCGRRIWAEDNYGSDSVFLCERCYDENYTHCEECGRLISFDDAVYGDGDIPYCNACYDDLSSDRSIHDYGYKPEPIFYGKTDLYMGVELEIDCGGEISDNADKLLEITNFDDEKLYIKHDGSIDDGMELISHPMDIEYHKNEMPWKKLFEKAIALGYRSHQTPTCGFHIHVSRSALGGEHETQEEVVARIVYFVEAHWNELLKFSRRTQGNIMRWASRYGIEENTKKTYDKAKKGNMGRYVCVNLQNYDTIEFRIFRGTLKYETFIATLQLVHEICNRAIEMFDDEFEGMSWSEFVRGINREEKPELINYLKLKQLYINEPIDETEEI